MAKFIKMNRCRYIGLGAATIGGAAISTGGSIISGPLTAYLQHKYAQEDRVKNYQYNEMAADNADARERAQWRDMYSMEAQLRQIRENGLSPSLMMSGDVPGTQGAAGHQGQGAAGPSTGPISPLLDMSAFANLGPAMAQAENQKAQAEYYHTLAASERGETAKSAAQIREWLTQAGLNDALKAYNESLKVGQDIENRFNNETYEYHVSQAYSDSNYAATMASKAVFDCLQSQYTADYLEKTLDDRVSQVAAEVSNIKADTALKWAQEALARKGIELNDAQIKQLTALANWYKDDAEIRRTFNDIESGRAESYKKFVEGQVEYWQKYAQNLADRLGFDKDKWSTEKQQAWTQIIGTLAINGLSSLMDIIMTFIPGPKVKPIGFK